MPRTFRYVALSALLAWMWCDFSWAQLRGEMPELAQPHQRLYTARGYALGNVHYVVTDDSVVVIDTTESPAAAQATLDEFRKHCDLPIRHVIYTHHHGDHINGTRVFGEHKPEIIAQAGHVDAMRTYRMLQAYNSRLNAIQFGATLAEVDRGLQLALDPRRPELGYVPPTRLVDEEMTLEIGGVRFELFHARGETDDHLIVWMPEERIAFPGDLYYPAFPMLASPMKPNRPVLAWAESLDRIGELEPEILVPSHGPAVVGRSAVAETLANYAKAIRIVHDETVKGLNQGLSLDEIRRRVKLPDELASLPYLAPIYGRVPWGVNGVYRQYTGWYDMNPANLNPGPVVERCRALVEAAGGAAAILRRAQAALDGDQPQLALELTDVALTAGERGSEAHQLSAKALHALADAAENGVERNIYRAAAGEHERAAETSE